MIPVIERILGHCVIFSVNILSIITKWLIVRVDAKQIAAHKHEQTTNDDYSVDMGSWVSDQPVKYIVHYTTLSLISVLVCVMCMNSEQGGGEPEYPKIG